MRPTPVSVAVGGPDLITIITTGTVHANLDGTLQHAQVGAAVGVASYPSLMMRRLIPALLGTLALGGALLQPATSAPSAAPMPSLQQLLDRAGQDGLPFDPELASVTCPYERGPVKEGSDADRYKVSTTVAATSVYYLRTRPKPSTYPRNNRLSPYELHTYAVTAYLTQYKVESDGDLHLVLKDSSGRSMIAEIPCAPCVPTTSRWKSAITNTRTVFAHTYSATTSWKYVKRSVTVRGLAMFDPLHGQTGVAPNGIELHPVIALAFH